MAATSGKAGRACHLAKGGSLLGLRLFADGYPQMTRKFFLPTLLLHLGIIFRVIEHECYCENCHCIWNLPPKLASPVQSPASL